VLRGNSPEVLTDDPLRCLRAYRLAAELGLRQDPETMGWVANAAPGLAGVALERVGAEFTRLVTPLGLADRLRAMDESGVLFQVLPEMEGLKGVKQGGYHHLDVWGHTLALLDGLEALMDDPQPVFRRSADTLGGYSASRQARLRLKLAGLLHDIAKPQCAVVQDGWTRFFGHERVGSEVAFSICRRLRVPRDVAETVACLVKDHMRPIMLVNGVESPIPTVSAMRRLVKDCEPDGLGVLLLAAADVLACRGPATDPEDRARRLDNLDLALAQYIEWTRQERFEPLLRGRHLIDQLGLKPGPGFSEILKAVEQAQIDGEVRTLEEALRLARSLV